MENNKQPDAPQGAARRALVLVVDDEEAICAVLQDALERSGCETRTARDGRQALRICREVAVDLVITDLAMPEEDGFETIGALRRECPDTPVIAISGMFGTVAFLSAAKHLGAAAVFAKPLDVDKIVETVHSLLDTIC